MPLIRGSLENLPPLIDVGIANHGRPDARETAKALIASAATTERRRGYEFSPGPFCDVEDRSGATRTLHVFSQPIIAPHFRDSPSFDVLIGMDLLSTGTLAPSKGGAFSFES